MRCAMLIALHGDPVLNYLLSGVVVTEVFFL
jgi:hypothetical protein